MVDVAVLNTCIFNSALTFEKIMIYTSENNWYSWSYGDSDHFGRQDLTDIQPFRSHFGKYAGAVETFKEETYKAARSIVDHYPGMPIDLMVSGGIDSELILRSFIGIKHPVNVKIFRYENDINIYDVSYAVIVCEQLHVPYTIIDFNLQKFYEQDAESISEKAQIDRPRMLPQLKFLDYCDGLPIIGHADMWWFREHDDYTRTATWNMDDYEFDVGCDKYSLFLNRPAITEWFKWSPGLILSYLELQWFKDLISDKYKGRLGVNSTKIIGYKEMYPDMIKRVKKTGFEKIDTIIDEVEKALEIKYNGLPFRQIQTRSMAELIKEIRGN